MTLMRMMRMMMMMLGQLQQGCAYPKKPCKVLMLPIWCMLANKTITFNGLKATIACQKRGKRRRRGKSRRRELELLRAGRGRRHASSVFDREFNCSCLM